MKNETLVGVVIMTLAFTLTFFLVRGVYGGLGVKDPFFALATDALIASLVAFYFSKRD